VWLSSHSHMQLRDRMGHTTHVLLLVLTVVRTHLILFNSRQFNATAVQCYGCSMLRLFNATAVQCYGCSMLRLFNSTAVRCYGCSRVPLRSAQCLNYQLLFDQSINDQFTTDQPLFGQSKNDFKLLMFDQQVKHGQHLNMPYH
jgi:hypothetical protein